MFDNITAPKAKSRTGASMALSVVIHGALVFGLVFGLAKVKEMQSEKEVDVVFKARPPPPPPPPPPPAAKKQTTPRTKPKPTKTPPRQMIQPKEVPKVE